MNLKNRIKYAGMAAALALSLTTPTFAAGVTNGTTPFDPNGKGGDTIISIYESKVDTGNLSVEVPLYLTLAVVSEDPDGTNAKLLAPKNYHIANTSKKSDGTTQASYPIAVTGVYIDRMGDWNLKTYNFNGTDNGAGAGNGKDMTLRFSGKAWKFGAGAFTQETTATSFDFPEVDNTKPNVGIAIENYDESPFYDATGARYKGINPGESLDIEINGGVATGYQVQGNGAGAAAPQFRVTYTVCALDPATGDAIGTPYAGNSFGPFPHDGLLEAGDKQNSNFDKDSNPIKKP